MHRITIEGIPLSHKHLASALRCDSLCVCVYMRTNIIDVIMLWKYNRLIFLGSSSRH